MEHLEEGDEQHEDDDSERLPQRLQGNVLLLLPAQGFPEIIAGYHFVTVELNLMTHESVNIIDKHLLFTHGFEKT